MKFFKHLVSRFFYSSNYAIEGILHAAKTQPHIRFHLLATIFLLILCFVFGIRQDEFITLAIMAAIVIVAEMINSAIEVTVDIASPQRSEKARIAKDIAAGAVLIAAATSIVVAFYVLFPYFKYFYYNGLSISRHNTSDISVFSIIIVMIIVIMSKAYFGEGHPLKGGLPSGHTAMAFCLAVCMYFITGNWFVFGGFSIFAAIIGYSRVHARIHSVFEVLVGAVIGFSVTYMLFMIFYY